MVFDFDTITLNHPGNASGYSLQFGNNKFCYLLDNEFESSQESELVKFCKGSNSIIWDGMYTEKELKTKKGWGHSSIEQGITFSEKTACKNLAIAHHAPNRNDEQLNEHSNNLSSDKVFFAHQGLSHTCLLYTSPSPRDVEESRMPSSA